MGRKSIACKKNLVCKLSEKFMDVYGPIPWKIRYNAGEELVYTILSQHTSDLNSERAFKSLMMHFGTLDAIADAAVGEIEKTIRHGGLSKSKAPRIKQILNQIRSELGDFDLTFLSEMPLAEAKLWLTRLKGVGPKTAAIILCFSFGMPAMPVDTHIHRVSKRLRLIGPKTTAEDAHESLERIVPEHEVFQFHMFLIKHGRDTCKARYPKCDSCEIAQMCFSRGKV